MSVASKKVALDGRHSAFMMSWFTHGTLWPLEAFYVEQLREELGIEEPPPASFAVADLGQMDWGGFL